MGAGRTSEEGISWRKTTPDRAVLCSETLERPGTPSSVSSTSSSFERPLQGLSSSSTSIAEDELDPEKLRQAYFELRHVFDSVQHQLGQAQNDNSSWRSHCSAAETTKSVTTKVLIAEIAKVKKQEEALQRERSALSVDQDSMQQQRQDMQDQARGWERERLALLQERDRLQQLPRDMQRQYDALALVHSSTVNHLSTAHKSNEDMEMRLTNAYSLRDGQQTSFAMSVERIEAELRQERSQASRLETDLQEATLRNVQLSAENAQQLAQLRDHSSRVDALLRQAQDDDRRRQQLMAEVEQLQHSLAELAAQLDGERAGNEQLLSRVEAASGALAELKANVEACSASQKPVEEELEKLSSCNAEHGSAVRSVEARVLEQQQQLDALQSCLHSCRSDVSKALLQAGTEPCQAGSKRGRQGPLKFMTSLCAWVLRRAPLIAGAIAADRKFGRDS